MKKISSLLLMLAMLLACFSGCSNGRKEALGTEKANIELWVVTEKTRWDGMNSQTRTLIKEFEETHENVTIKLDIIPLDPEERDIYLEKLRVQIISGKGPDVYLLPTSGTMFVESVNRYPDVTVEKLFHDEYLTMYNGHFADISEYYDADESLGKEQLVTEIMNAGVLDGARYILPLRYDYPVIYAATDRLETLNTDLDVLKSGIITDIMDLAIDTGNGKLASAADTVYFRSKYLLHFSNCIDYENEEVTLSVEEAEGLLEKYRRIYNLAGNTGKYKSASEPYLLGGTFDHRYIMEGEHLDNSDCILMSGYLKNIMEAVAVSKAVGFDLTMIPVRNGRGELVANVTYYGAVGSGSEYPETAYAFLRMFLLGDSQWENNRERQDLDKNSFDGGSTAGYIAEGWPVRCLCEAENLWKMYYTPYVEKSKKGEGSSGEYYYVFNEVEGSRPRYKQIRNVEITNEDLAILEMPIDKVMFDLTLGADLVGIANSLVFPEVGSANAHELAEELIKKLELHLAEG